MPVVRMAHQLSEIPSDAKNVQGFCNVANGSMGHDVIGPSPMWTYEEYNGLCLYETERNGSFDSDFYMTIWNPEKQEPFTICFATTRGWSYPCYASRADATDEVKAAFKAYTVEQDRKARADRRKAQALALKAKRAQIKAIAEANALPYAKLLKLRHSAKFDGMLALFSPRVRSGFKISLRNQLIKFLTGQTSYGQPFSKKQMDYI